ncbi:hypothetical protein ABZ883_01520 [Streptomyces sp. NPDC046977]|uniref:hypothetical protein n=1 Tax=Streptomyces sp. NPDC046977 TaxID=3154703 RepID=UPI0033C057F9
MLRSLEITASVSGVRPDHLLYWVPRMDLNLDCFICERSDRTTVLSRGAERAGCTGDRDREHFTAARISAFDSTGPALRSIVDFWWAPFRDTKRDVAAEAPARHPWVRLYLGYWCPTPEAAAETTTQTNLVRPHIGRCKHCETELYEDSSSPAIRLLG